MIEQAGGYGGRSARGRRRRGDVQQQIDRLALLGGQRLKGDGNRKLDLDEYIVHEPSGERKAASVGLSRLRRASRPGASGSRLRAW